MPHLTADQKHAILTHWSERDEHETLDDIARKHDVSFSRASFYNWLQQWDGTRASLQRKPATNRQRALSSRQVEQYIRKPILAANREHRAIHYPQLHKSLQLATCRVAQAYTVSVSA